MTSTFKYIEYSGDDASDVLVSLLMNLAHPELASGEEVEVRENESTTQVKDTPVGFTPNDVEDDEDE